MDEREIQVTDLQENEHKPNMIAISDQRFEMKITVGVMRKLRKFDPPIDITRLVDDRDPDGGLWARMRDDPSIVVDIVHEVIKTQLDDVKEFEKFKDPELFADMLGGDDLERLYDATLRAIVLFSPSPKNRKALTKIIDRIATVEGQLLDQAIEKIDSGEIDKAILKAVDEHTTQSTNESKKSRARQGSTQGGTHSES